MIISLCNQKGGAGKTTLTMLLGYALADAGKKVGIIDRDPQETSKQWLSVSGMDNIEIAKNKDEYDVIFIDTPGNLQSEALLKSIQESDRVILVSSTSPADLWATQRASQFIEQNKKKGSKTALLFNQVIANTRLSRNLTDYAEKIGLNALNNVIPQRQSFQHSAVIGWDALKSDEKSLIQRVAIEIVTL